MRLLNVGWVHQSINGLFKIGKSSFATTFVAGKNLEPNPATGKITVLISFEESIYLSILITSLYLKNITALLHLQYAFVYFLYHSIQIFLIFQ